MRLTITMDLDNSSFEDGGTEEIRRILSDLCERLPEPLKPTSGDYTLHDANGNWCGSARID
jgi:hypothetical protein